MSRGFRRSIVAAAVPSGRLRVRTRAATPLVLAVLLPLTTVSARTITLSDRDADGAASISEQNPLAGWAGCESAGGWFQDDSLCINPQQAALIRYPLDKIPAGQRIVNAELSLPIITPYAGQRIFVWRLLAGWGLGVCHLYRQARPEKLAWAKPGARGSGVDRAVEPTRIVPIPANSPDIRIDVTRDVQLWYNGAAKNHGWLITSEDENQWLYIYSPAYQGYARWLLRVTYEPP